ncbi:hypothetical protein [Microbacterium rhizosphaerae]|uniref:Histidine kinase N-terminal 7TM region domain-containing protein n=1 Tax=Microbacterium rhizosphaerae TaxID=1678237 RepID=A0ABZ0SMH1_9MICO|nr:hypothetical protein [Microbacterium rhizosphaerae]WPR89685.1 hypothetical protein SM116_18305 [Microbacterium rhizosphaerae]
MIQILVAALMWMLVASLLILRRGRAERSITYSAVTIAVAMTLNIDAAYRWVDRLAGGRNVVTLLADLALMVGIFFLGRGVAKATEYKSHFVRIALGPLLLSAAVVGVSLAFAFIRRGATTTTFMLDLGAQPAAAAYSVIEYAYNGVIVTVMAIAAAWRIGQSRGVERLPAVALLLGSMCGLVLSIVIIAMDVAHVVGNDNLMLGLGVLYSPLFLVTFILLCLGLASLPAIRWVRARGRAEKTQDLVARITPAWERASSVRPGVSSRALGSFTTEDAEAKLHRQIVEIRDALFDPRVSFTLTVAERQLVESAEAHLTGRDAPAATDSEPRLGRTKAAH